MVARSHVNSLGQPAAVAGYGFKAVTGGDGKEHVAGVASYTKNAVRSMRVVESTRMPSPRQATLPSSWVSPVPVNWAHANRLAQGKSVCIRYDSMYAAHIATGLWKAKKHKPMAATARQAWARLKRSREGQAWMAHVKGHTGNRWNERADRLAAQGRGGKSIKRYFDG